ncbi:hypothetical protein HYH03_007966 [Edaphochlamys debaryana]|uniref:MYND-type domain-containing protein n=1 Tax=Edaphochlamys debaryana TaxID=47281 RepID=A0A835Y0P5_9CHLO|nr:hypothetical protein HYH03_007966 [Edaphochlamys debaryana]|eukprot:KAG2493743.1 hypothetical protein HYH03_007966 [Edaphochlamys debaryana]
MQEPTEKHFNIASRSNRVFKCPCPGCGNYVYVCPLVMRPCVSLIPHQELSCERRPPAEDQAVDPLRGCPAEWDKLLSIYRAESRMSAHSDEEADKAARRLGKTYKSWYVDPAACRSAQEGLQALAALECRSEPEALRLARHALSLCAHSPDACAVVARLSAGSLEEALELYERGAAGVEQMLSEDGRRRLAAHAPLLAAALPYQGAARCMVGAVGVLCRLRRAAEAYDKLQALLRITPSPADEVLPEVWGIAPEVIFRAQGPAACLSWMERHLCAQGFRWTSLRWYDDERRPGGTASAMIAAMHGGRPAAEKLRSGLGLALMCCWLPHALDIILGDLPEPGGPMPLIAMPGSIGAQVAYARCCGDLWRSTQGVLEYAWRFRNTYELFGLLWDARRGRPAPLAAFRRYACPPPPPGVPPTAAPFFKDGLLFEDGDCWHGLVQAAVVLTKEGGPGRADATFTADELEMLRTLLAAGCPLDPAGAGGYLPRPENSPLVAACYRGYGPDVVLALLKAGADPLRPDDSGSTPLLAAAEQGMWRELQAILKSRRKLGPMTPVAAGLEVLHVPGRPCPMPHSVFEATLQIAFHGDCLPCSRGDLRHKGCFRCTDDEQTYHTGSPHGPWCNFDKVIEVLVAYGMRSVSDPMLAWMRVEAEAGTASHRKARAGFLARLEAALREAKESAKTPAATSTAAATATGTAVATGATAAAGAGTQAAAAAAGAAATGAKGTAGAAAAAAGATGTKAGAGRAAQAAAAAAGLQRAASSASSSSEPATPRSPSTAAPQAQAEAQAGPCQAQEAVGGGGASPAPLQAVALVAAPQGVQDETHCWYCGKAKDRSSGVKLRKCGRCLAARYCSDACQAEHWPQHREGCGALAEARLR